MGAHGTLRRNAYAVQHFCHPACNEHCQWDRNATHVAAFDELGALDELGAGRAFGDGGPDGGPDLRAVTRDVDGDKGLPDASHVSTGMTVLPSEDVHPTATRTRSDRIGPMRPNAHRPS